MRNCPKSDEGISTRVEKIYLLGLGRAVEKLF
jgi:hypothetical protein